MLCSGCSTKNDDDAAFCVHCGKALQGVPLPAARQRRPYLYMFMLVPVLVIVAGLGYYKFFLPDGIAAVVNGEEIKRSELDSVVARSQRVRPVLDPRFRYQALNMLITERLILQEAAKAGMMLSPAEVTAAIAEARTATGLDEGSFQRTVAADYGSMQAYVDMLRRRLLISRFISEKVVPGKADSETSRMSRDRWIQNLVDRASIRIALAEEMQGPGCSNGCGAACTQTKAAQGAPHGGCARTNGAGCNRMNKP